MITPITNDAQKRIKLSPILSEENRLLLPNNKNLKISTSLITINPGMTKDRISYNDNLSMIR